LIDLANREIRALLRMLNGDAPVPLKAFPKGVGATTLEALVAGGLAAQRAEADGGQGYVLTAEGLASVESGRYARPSKA